MACSACEKRRSTARASGPESSTKVPRVGSTAPVRYVVNGKSFSTLTAAQDYARTQPGAVIRQM